MRVAVVGAGFAGLAAAVALDRAGVDVVVLEARGRVGGRVHSQRLGDPDVADPDVADRDLVVERGAEFVLEGDDVLRGHVEREGLRLADTGMRYHVREVPGMGADRLRSAEERLVVAAAQAPAGTGIADVVERLWPMPRTGLPDELADTLLARIEITCALAAGRLEASAAGRVLDLHPAASHRIAGGNQSLAEALARRLRGRVHLRRPVRRVVWSPTSVELDTDGATVLVDRAVVAVPAPVLRDLPVDPPLPGALRGVLDGLAFGEAAKLHVPLAATPPTSAVMAASERFWTWTATGPSGGVAPVVHAFAGSAPALAGLEVAEGPCRWVDRVRRLRPDLALRPDGAVLATWSDDPWAGGAYTAHTVDAPVPDVAWWAPVGPLHLAGEHTAGAYHGCMEGALRSGDRVAREVLLARTAEGPTA